MWQTDGALSRDSHRDTCFSSAVTENDDGLKYKDKLRRPNLQPYTVLSGRISWKKRLIFAARQLFLTPLFSRPSQKETWDLFSPHFFIHPSKLRFFFLLTWLQHRETPKRLQQCHSSGAGQKVNIQLCLPALQHPILSRWVASGVGFNWVKAWRGRHTAGEGDYKDRSLTIWVRTHIYQRPSVDFCAFLCI